jgi:outer membrane protein assembly complex protein YaeT
VSLALACLAGPAAHEATAQEPPGGAPAAPEAPGEPPRIRSVAVQGNSFTDETRILRTFEVNAGQTFSADAIRRGQRKLFALGLFSDLHIDRVDHPEDNTVEIVIRVVERPRIAAITFEGQKQREDTDLEKKLFLKAGEPYSGTTAATQVDSLLKYYHDEGFSRAKITFQADTLEDQNRVNLRFMVNEGLKVRITGIRFEGMAAFREAQLRKAMKTKKHWLLGGGEIKDEQFAEDREKLEGWYHDHGFRDMRVEDATLEQGALPRDLTLVVKIYEGRVYQQGAVRWEGNKVLPTGALMRQWPKGEAGPQPYSVTRIQKALSGAYGEYAEQGYLYIGIEPREAVVQDSIVDITFMVNEVSPSHIKRLSITGNKGTREKVVRREINIREGDLFRRSALMRARDDVMRLGIFNQVTPDFTPAESTDVNLVFKVEEKQVGTASAGAGYTNEAGLTGFLEIGHNNVLGNGQQLSLHLERGGKRQDYRVSFTEPWFHDSPTLLGFSAYNTSRILDEYDQQLRGVSGRIGRPLPWPDYSHGSMSYTVERVLFSNVPRGHHAQRHQGRHAAAHEHARGHRAPEQHEQPVLSHEGHATERERAVHRRAVRRRPELPDLAQRGPGVPAVDPQAGHDHGAPARGDGEHLSVDRRHGAGQRALPARRRQHPRPAAWLRRLPGRAGEIRPLRDFGHRGGLRLDHGEHERDHARVSNPLPGRTLSRPVHVRAAVPDCAPAARSALLRRRERLGPAQRGPAVRPQGGRGHRLPHGDPAARQHRVRLRVRVPSRRPPTMGRALPARQRELLRSLGCATGRGGRGSRAMGSARCCSRRVPRSRRARTCAWATSIQPASGSSSRTRRRRSSASSGRSRAGATKAAEKEKTVANLRKQVKDQSPVLSALKRQELDSSLQKAISDYEKFVQDVWGQDGRAAQENARATDEIVGQVRRAVEKVAGQKGLDLVLDVTGGFVVYADKTLDLTNDVLAELNSNAAGTTPH